MTREVLIWPVGKETEAFAYGDLADAAYAALTGNPGDVWVHRDWYDRHGQLVMAYFGPTGGEWNGAGLVESPELLAARADAVLSSSVDWPEPEEA